ncbi:transposase [Flavobacterium sp. '19STA2R22 D10 B1']|uniref:transposase n=1 Tax=Flavobacterium aerium TaxID=3037261 RepID=UPI00278BF688|nr:transposase [Flavobacterium sp. '19STA2R22 D10 B1']
MKPNIQISCKICVCWIQAIDFRFLYKATRFHYGQEGPESIDSVVFFKIRLVGYLNNINSDRKFIEYCSNCLDVHLFLRYDLDESLSRHSTYGC